VRIGVIQKLSQSARTGQNWYSHDNRGACLFAGAGLFSGNYREKSPLTGAITSNFKVGDLVGVHVRGEHLTFSKNGVRIPGEMCRSGVFAASLFVSLVMLGAQPFRAWFLLCVFARGMMKLSRC
jgi:hypothetical protein